MYHRVTLLHEQVKNVDYRQDVMHKQEVAFGNGIAHHFCNAVDYSSFNTTATEVT